MPFCIRIPGILYSSKASKLPVLATQRPLSVKPMFTNIHEIWNALVSKAGPTTLTTSNMCTL